VFDIIHRLRRKGNKTRETVSSPTETCDSKSSSDHFKAEQDGPKGSRCEQDHWSSFYFLCAAIIPLRGASPSGVIANPPNPEPEEKTFQWGHAVTQSFAFLAVEHSIRLTQGKTRRELSGKLFNDYFDSVSKLQGWGDGDGVFTNYIGHPMQGAVASFIQIQNDPKGKQLDFGNNSEYWHSRLKAFAWSAAYSTQFEVGPVSEAQASDRSAKYQARPVR
jgi:hypothetical protein